MVVAALTVGVTVGNFIGRGCAHAADLNVEHQGFAREGMVHIQVQHEFTDFGNARVLHAFFSVDLDQHAWQQALVLARQMFYRHPLHGEQGDVVGVPGLAGEQLDRLPARPVGRRLLVGVVVVMVGVAAGVLVAWLGDDDTRLGSAASLAPAVVRGSAQSSRT